MPGRLRTAVVAMGLLLTWVGPAGGDAVDVYRAVSPGVVTIVNARSAQSGPAFVPGESLAENRILGSGVIVSEDGFVLTAWHVVAGTMQIDVVTSDFTKTSGRVVASEPILDVALVKIQAVGLKPVPWRADEPATVGERVYAIGTPAVFVEDPTPSISAGIVGAVHREIAVGADSIMTAPDLIETDAQLSSGESGGALVDAQGRLIGMCVAVYSPQGAALGRAYAVATDAWLAKAVDAMREGRPVAIGDLGAQVSAIGEGRARPVGVPPMSGVEVTWCREGGAFADAGILPGDIVTTINAQPVRRTGRFRQMEIRLEPGSTATVRVIRPGAAAPLVLDVKVDGADRTPREVQVDFRWRGMRLAPLTDDLRREYGTHYRDGVFVKDIDAVSSAYHAGLRIGDVIVEINNVAVKNLADFQHVAETIPQPALVILRTTTGIAHIQGEIRKQ